MGARAAGIIISAAGAILGVYAVILIQGYLEDLRVFVILIFFSPNPEITNILTLILELMLFMPPRFFLQFDHLILVSLAIAVGGTIVASLGD